MALIIFFIVLRTLHGDSARGLPMYVVEEHGEALPYWIDHLVEGAVLVHVDAHPDNDLPLRLGHKGLKGGGSLDPMQSRPQANVYNDYNDEFVTAAAYMNVIDTFVWVWPSWDNGRGGRHDQHAPLKGFQREHTHAISEMVALGTMRDSDKQCWCRYSIKPWDPLDALPEHAGSISSCQGKLGTPTNCDLQPIPTQSCSISKKLRMISVGEHVLLGWNETQIGAWLSWLRSFPSGILDLCEDFFGQVNTPNRFYEALGKKAEVYDDVLAKFCPASAGMSEATASETLTSAVREVRKCRQKKACAPKFPVQLDALACGHWPTLQKTLAKMTDNELLMIEHTGATLTQSLASTLDLPGLRSNSQPPRFVELDTTSTDESIALLRSPIEIDRRLGKFGGVLDRLTRNYSVGTLCRSIRDGFTPREWAQWIEESVKSNLAAWCSSQELEISYYFDSSLLGGPIGQSPDFKLQLESTNTSKLISKWSILEQALGQENLENRWKIQCNTYIAGTPLHLAACDGNSSVVEFLLNLGAEPSAAHKRFGQPMHVAAREGHTAVINLLAGSRASIIAKNQRGKQPLHVAAKWGHKALVQLLSEKSQELEKLLPEEL